MHNIDANRLLHVAVRDDDTPQLCGSSLGFGLIRLGCTLVTVARMPRPYPQPALPLLGFARCGRAALSGYVRSPTRCGFYNELGAVDEGRLAGLIPQGQVSSVVQC